MSRCHIFCALSTFGVLLSFATRADDFQASLAKLNQRGQEISRRLGHFGIRPSEMAAPQMLPALSPSRESAAPSLVRILAHESPLRAPAGKLLYGIVRNRLVVGPDAVPAILDLDSDQGIFSGLKLLGSASQSSTSGRIEIHFDRLVMRSGQVIQIQGEALDESGALGLEAEVFSGKLWATLGAIGSGVIAGAAATQQTLSPTALGFSQVEPSARNAILGGLAQSAADQSRQLLEAATQEKPVLVLGMGSSAVIYLGQEVRF